MSPMTDCTLPAYLHLQSTLFICANEPHWGREPDALLWAILALLVGYIVGRVCQSYDPGD